MSFLPEIGKSSQGPGLPWVLERCEGGAEDDSHGRPPSQASLRQSLPGTQSLFYLWPCILKLITQIVGESRDKWYESQFGKSLMSHVNEAECDFFCTS